MNPSQTLWWEQSRSDLKVLDLLRRHKAEPCHQLHYLQMIAEKLAKAYFWGKGNPPPKKHSVFLSFIKALGTVGQSRQEQRATALGFHNFNHLQLWIRHVMPLAADLERLAPALAGDGPNPEYPWPHNPPSECPAHHQFALWDQLINSGNSRQLVKFIDIAVHNFPTYC